MATTEHEPIEHEPIEHEPPAVGGPGGAQPIVLEPTGLQGPSTAEAQRENALVRYFELAKYNVTVGSEVMAGVTTFLVMA